MSWLYPVLPIAPDECPTSYLSRLARANFAGSVREFCRDIGLSCQAIATGCKEAFAMLASLTGIPTAQLDKNAIRDEDDCTTLRGEKLLRPNIRRSQVLVCPECLKNDVATSKLPPVQASYGRIMWRLAAIHTCPIHAVALVDIARADANTMYDFAVLAEPSLTRLNELARSAERRPASGLENYIVARVDRASEGREWLDSLDLFAAIKTCEMFGVAALFPRKHNLKTLTAVDWRKAGAAGYDIVRNGEAGIRSFLTHMHGTYREPRVPTDGPHARFGKLHEWATASADDPAYRQVRNVLSRCIVGIMPLGPGDVLFGQPISERVLHSIRTASLQTRMHAAPLRRVLQATGIVGATDKDLQDHRVLFDAIRAQPILEKLTGALTLKKAETYLNAGRVHTKLLLTHGFIIPILGGEAKLKAILFAPADLDRFIADLLGSARPVTKAEPGMASLAKAAKRANCSAMTIVGLVLDRKLKKVSRLAGTRGYASLLVDVLEVRAHVPKPRPAGMTARQVMTELGTFHAVVRALIDRGALPSRRAIHPVTRMPVTLVARDDLDAFRHKYVSLAELARTRRKHPRTVRRHLESRGIQPAPELDKSTYGIVFYRRADLAA